ncbi:hypothetical protein DMQ71_10710 [Klebsiella quasipneumoniae]|nr:hypothetical protein DMQ71_10710 [Klebsiella quasipneumoniae]
MFSELRLPSNLICRYVSRIIILPVILQVACALAITRPIPGPRPYGRSELRSNSFLANLSSLTPVTYESKLLGIRCVAACLQLELFRVTTCILYNKSNSLK